MASPLSKGGLRGVLLSRVFSGTPSNSPFWQGGETEEPASPSHGRFLASPLLDRGFSGTPSRSRFALCREGIAHQIPKSRKEVGRAHPTIAKRPFSYTP